MNREERDRLAEQFLDKALARYGDVEPRPGLEARILAKLQDADSASARPWHGWRWAAVAAAVVVIAIGVHFLRTTQKAGPSNSASSVAPVVKAPTPKATTDVAKATGISPQRTRGTQRARNPQAARSTRTRAEGDGNAPRLAQFPAPGPLSQQEHLLISYLQRTPREEIITVVNENETFNKELQRRVREAEEMRTPTE